MVAAAPPVDERLQRRLRLRTRGKLPAGGRATVAKITARSDDDDNEVDEESEGDEGDDGNFPKGGARTASATTTTIPAVGDCRRGMLQPGRCCHRGRHLPTTRSSSAVIQIRQQSTKKRQQ